MDRNSEIVAHIFDKRNPAVKRSIADLSGTREPRNGKIGNCGQVPGDYPEFAAFLVECVIGSFS